MGRGLQTSGLLFKQPFFILLMAVLQTFGLFLFSCATGTYEYPASEEERAANRGGEGVPEDAAPSGIGSARFGVFTGLGPEHAELLGRYEFVVVDAQYYNSEDIAFLHEQGTRVYTYLNIGSIEEFRPYYKEFEHLALGDYEGWDDEQWIDIAAPAWQRYLIRVLAWDIAKKGVDGFFIDNADVYDHYPERDIYDGIMETLEQLGEEYGLPVIINGGAAFVKEALERKALNATTVRGISQENVFTLPDLRTGRFGKQSADATKLYQSYLSLCKSAGLEVSIIEYLKDDASLRKQILDYCERSGFAVFIADSLALDRDGR